ncbi:GNAT family N-acetyltransferase [Entomomonas asaccharolytica]|uniref:N-acetyltransferase n=1 Tax=Entomomonas asaccharolytica TaxID=2785331 RepID=A0A974RX63_9GAMM|nr:GNAT family N-acetyltransferase [Entomomonas asaccharolytica]QQP85893.1 N-acetyltransferase [Entomomonas asaccharolytica]
MIIRSCEFNDIPMITAIYAEAVINGTATFELEPPSELEMTKRREALLANNYPYLVADKDGIVVGYAYAGEYHKRPAFHGTVEDSIYIHQNFQGKGMGTELLKQLIVEATQRDFRQMIAVVGDSANHGSIALHKRQGFELIGTLHSVGWKHGRWLDTVIMQRPLGDADNYPYKKLNKL